MADVDLVVFDLGGVLIRAARTFSEAWGLSGLPATPWTRDAEFVRAHDSIVFEFGTGRMDTDAYCERVSALTRGDVDAATVRRVLDAWIQAEYADVGSVFDVLEAGAVQTAVLTNTNPSHWARLMGQASTPAEYPTVLRVQHPFASHLVRMGKPDPALFAHVAKRTGVRGDRILFFDDVAEYVSAARAVGWRAEHIDHTRETAPQLLGHLVRYGVG